MVRHSGPAGTDHLLDEAGRGGDNLEAGTSVAVKIYKLSLYMKYRQVLKDILGAEVVNNPGVAVMAEGDSEDKKFEGFLSLFRSKIHKKRPGGVPRSVYCWFYGTHGEPCHTTMGAKLFRG